MKLNKIYINLAYAFLFFIIGISLISSFSVSSTGSNSQASANFESSLCKQAQDLVIQVAPFGCSPLRTDLLEEQDVTVYCKLQAMKVNPLINVKSIESISFINKNYSPQIFSVAFFPANSFSGNREVLTSSLFNDIGSLAVTVKKQTDPSLVPEFVSGNLTAEVKYNRDDEFGIGKSTFYLKTADEDSQEKDDAFSFWDNRGYLKLQTIENEKAEISVYFLDKEIKTVTLKKGETSNKIILPTSKCGSGLTLKLEDFNSLTLRAKIRLDSEVIEVAKGEKFLNNKCVVKEILNNGLSKYVKISCQDNKGNQELSLSITPKVNLSIDGIIEQHELGDYLYDAGDKKVYLVYVGGKNGDLLNNQNLILFFAALPKKDKTKLSPSELSSFKKVLTSISKSREDFDSNNNGIIKVTSRELEKMGTMINDLFRKVFLGEEILMLEFNQELAYKNKKISISSLAGAQNEDFENSEKEDYYKKAFENYQKLIDDFSEISYKVDAFGDEISYGQEALTNQIILTNNAKQKATLEELCSKFKENYPHKNLPSECNTNKLFNSQISESYLTIEGQNRRFSLEGIYEPGFNEYGVKLKIINSKSGIVEEYELEKDKAVSFPGLNGYLILTEIKDENSATIFFNLDDKDDFKKLREDLDLISDKKILQKNIDLYSESLGYSFVINDINFKKSAKVLLNSDSAQLGTKTNFSFKIEIEDRTIQLSPEVANKTIDFLNKSIITLSGISNFLNSWVEIQTGACYATAGLLAVNSFFSGNMNEFNARQTIMRGANGWLERCNNLVEDGTYSSSSACLLDKSDIIDKQVEELSQSIETQNKNINSLTSSINQDSSVKAQEELVKEYCNQVQTLLKNIPKEKLSSLNLVEEDINMLSLENWKIGKFSLDQLKSIGTYASLLDKTSDAELQKTANSELNSLFIKIRETIKIEESANSFFSENGIENGIIQDLSQSKTIKLYSFQKVSGLSQNLKDYFSGTLKLTNEDYILAIYDFKKQEKYIIGVSSSNLDVKSTYVLGQDGKLTPLKQDSANPLFLKIEFYAKSEYNNAYIDPELKYYNSEPYKGLPALVPVDVKQGWYAVIKQTTSLGGNIASYDDSGNVKSFYLGNVGQNGKFEFEVNGGDDTYKSINLDSPDPYSFPGISPAKAKEIILKAKEAIKQAEAIKESKRIGNVKINNQEVSIGQEAVSSVQMSCDDVLSHKECVILFNVCDPVMCPSSRCDFFGNYKNNPKNVKQTGIIGGLTLCLGNFVGFGGEVIVPVCVDGVKAGVDNLISVFNNTVDCLQKRLETGETIGVCDEILSVYFCDLLWKQVLSFGDGLLDLGLNYLANKNSGGGEYFNLREQYSLAKNAMDFFLNSYSSGAQKSFLTKTTKEISSGICKNFVSGVVPSFSEILPQIVKSESPVQFTGHFEEMPFTTAPVPAISHYKVFYHIYAGKDSLANYMVYLKGNENSDENSDKLVDSGAIEIGGSSSQSKDFTAPAGYKKLCISVNGQEECGFKEVSTSFSLDAINEMYVSDQASRTKITEEKECRSGTSILQGEGIYNRGIVRECSNLNPGIGTDPYINTEKARWKDVGYCGDVNIRCWIDSNSVKDTLEFSGLEDKALGEITQSDLAALGLNEGYLTSEETILAKIAEIEKQDDKTKEGLLKKIVLIDAIIDKVTILNYRTKLLLLRGNAYNSLFKLLEIKLEQKKEEMPPKSESERVSAGGVSKECFPESILEEVDEVRKAILISAKNLNGKVASRCLDDRYFSRTDPSKEPCIFPVEASCWDGAIKVYEEAVYNSKVGIGVHALYSDVVGKKYTFLNDKTENKQETITLSSPSNWNKYPFQVDSDLSRWKYNSNQEEYDEEDEKLALLQPGDLLSLVWNGHSGHNVVFLHWVNKEKHIAKLFDFNNNKCLLDSNDKVIGGKDEYDNCNYITKKFRCFEWDISDNSHPVYQIWQPQGSASGSDSEKFKGNLDSQGNQDKVKSDESPTLSHNVDSKINENLIRSINDGKIPLQDLFEKTDVKGFEEIDFSKGKEYFLSALVGNKNYLRIDPKNLQKGDLVIIGNKCNKLLKFGIFESFVTENNKLKIKYFSPKDFGSNPTSFPLLTEPISLDSIENDYIYNAYTYIGDLPENSKPQSYIKYDVYDVIDNINRLLKEGKITSDSKWLDSVGAADYGDSDLSFTTSDSSLTNTISRLVLDDIFSKSQCSDLWGGFLKGSPKSVRDLIPTIFSNSKIEGYFKGLYIDAGGEGREIIQNKYIEINPSKAKIGDIVQLRTSCKQSISNIGMITSGNDEVKKAFENSNNLKNPNKIGIAYFESKTSSLKYKKVLPNFMGENSNEEYIYKVYSKKESISPDETTLDPKLTLAKASQKIDDIYTSYPSLSKEYNSVYYEIKNNFPVYAYPLIKKIISDNILTEQECYNIFFSADATTKANSIEYVKNLLSSKCNKDPLCSKEKGEIGNSDPVGLIEGNNVAEKSLNLLKNNYFGQAKSIAYILHLSGVSIEDKGIQYTINLISKSPYFSKINLSTLKPGDIVFYGEDCDIRKNIGIVKSFSGDKVEYYFSSSKDNKLTLNKNIILTAKDTNLDWGKMTKGYIYAAYRYNKDLSDSDKKAIVKDLRIVWTLNSAYTFAKNQYTPDKDASYVSILNPPSYKTFVLQALYDGVLTPKECDGVVNLNEGAATLITRWKSRINAE